MRDAAMGRRGFLKTVGGAVVASASAGANPAERGEAAPPGPAERPASPVTAELARWAAGLRFEDLSPEAVHQAKRFLLDALACAVGGYRQHDVGIALAVLDEIAAPGPATLIGRGRKVDVVSAAFANALMVRVLDFNDIYWKQDPCHPSDVIPAALACAERARGGGRELVVGIALGYELECRLCEAAVPGIRDRGWHHATFTAIAAPAVAARMLRLPADAVQHAVGIAAAGRCTLGAVTAGKLSMMKNAADPLATQAGVLAALLAQRGFTGPEQVVEGREGLVHALGPRWNLDVLTAGLGASWRITRCGMKAFPTEALTHTPISAVLDLVVANDLQPESVASVHVATSARAAEILADPSKYDPRSKEAADHSLPYCVAVAIVHRQVGPAQFTPAALLHPAVRALLPKIRVSADPEVEKVFPALQRAVVTVETVDGRVLTRTVDVPKGDPRNPLGDREIEVKLAALSDGVLSRGRQRRVVDAVWTLERARSVSSVMGLLATDAAPPR